MFFGRDEFSRLRGLDVSAGLAFSIGLTTPERVFELAVMPDRIVFLRRFAVLDTRTPLGI